MKPAIRKSFVNVDDWIEAFELEPSVEMRIGMLNALCNPNNFEDQKGFNKRAVKKTITRVLIHAIYFSIEKRHELAAILASDLLLKNLLIPTRPGFSSSISKSVLIDAIECLGKMESYSSYNNEILNRDYLYRFLHAFPPNSNTAKENERIVSAIIQNNLMPEIFLSVSGWRGDKYVIMELYKKIKGTTNQASWTGKKYEYSDQLAAHIFATGRVNIPEIIKTLA